MAEPGRTLSAPPLNRNLSEQIAEKIGIAILTGEYAPGEILPEEPQLCVKFGVSRTVVREAVRMLVSKAMLEVRPRTGTRVLDPESWQLLDRQVLHWQQSIPIDGSNLRQLNELRQIAEPSAARLAAERRTDEDVSAITAALTTMEMVTDKPSEYVIADARFHVAVLRAAKNRYLDALESAIFTGLLLSIRVTNPGGQQNRKSLPYHKKIADAIIARDGPAAFEAMQEHLADSARRLTKSLG